MSKKLYFLLFLLLPSFSLSAQTPSSPYIPTIEGTVRAKYEYDTERNANRFQVRNARFSVNGLINSFTYYKAEIDLSDKGKTTMLDAYVQLRPLEYLSFTIGQQRIPFGNDVLRSPHLLFFANRSFIAKQMSSGLRDVGAMLSFKNDFLTPIELKAGVYNGKGIATQEVWEKELSMVLRASFRPTKNTDFNLGYFSFQLPNVRIMMYNVSASFYTPKWHLEAEYTLRTYGKKAASPTHALSTFLAYNIALQNCIFTKITPLIRFDRMTNSYGEFDSSEIFKVVEPTRSRITGGFTFSLDKPFLNDIRLNYEQYFYSAEIDKGDKKIDLSKLVLEFVVRF